MAKFEIYTLRTGRTFLGATTRTLAERALKDLNGHYPPAAPKFGIRETPRQSGASSRTQNHAPPGRAS